MTLDSTARQKAETLATGVARSVIEEYRRSGVAENVDPDLLDPFVDLVGGREDDGSVFVKAVCCPSRPSCCKGIWIISVSQLAFDSRSCVAMYSQDNNGAALRRRNSENEARAAFGPAAMLYP